MRLSINHTTHYAYDTPVDYALQRIRLRPPETSQQTVHSWALEIEGGQIETSYIDHNGANVDLVGVTRGATEVKITARGEIDTIGTSGVLGKTYGPAALWYYLKNTHFTQPGPAIDALANALRGEQDTLTGLHGLSTAILAALPYATGATFSETTAEEALKGDGGVCQDHSQIFVSAARSAGIPARYVSGYLMMNDRIDQDASHAWAEAYVDGLGWVGFDISNAISPDERYVRLASGLDYQQAAPITGLRLGDATETMVVSLQVEQ